MEEQNKLNLTTYDYNKPVDMFNNNNFLLIASMSYRPFDNRTDVSYFIGRDCLVRPSQFNYSIIQRFSEDYRENWNKAVLPYDVFLNKWDNELKRVNPPYANILSVTDVQKWLDDSQNISLNYNDIDMKKQNIDESLKGTNGKKQLELLLKQREVFEYGVKTCTTLITKIELESQLNKVEENIQNYRLQQLNKIVQKYIDVSYKDNYDVGGGLDNVKFASNRHENAKYDGGKLTLGEANNMFVKATGLTTNEIKELILYKFPNLEWHHAGKLPKSYEGGMKKTYFINSKEIVEFAQNFYNIKNKYADDLKMKEEAKQRKKTIDELKNKYLQEYASKVVRLPRSQFNESYFIPICYEMSGKFGWFESDTKYNLPEYITAWVFKSDTDYAGYYNIEATLKKQLTINDIPKDELKLLGIKVDNLSASDLKKLINGQQTQELNLINPYTKEKMNGKLSLELNLDTGRVKVNADFIQQQNQKVGIRM